MRNASVWRRLLGLSDTVVEDVVFDDSEGSVGGVRSGLAVVLLGGAGAAGAEPAASTRARADGDGGPLMWA